MSDLNLMVILDHAADRLEDDPSSAADVITALAVDLRQIKRDQPPDEWKASVAVARSHQLRGLVHEDPLTHRAFTKPRGYQGDAELLDVIYTKDYAALKQPTVSQLGHSIFSYTIECQAPAAVRERKTFLLDAIERSACETNRPHVLSVACGHLRELEMCPSLKEQRIGRFVGLDQDPASVESVRQRYGSAIETVEGSIKLLLGGALTKQRFDFIYAAGLYDYLEDRLAERLTEKMFTMLKPGGRLLVANYLPDIPDVGYMETYMGWELIYRSDEQLHAVAKNIAQSDVADVTLQHDSKSNIVYLTMQKS